MSECSELVGRGATQFKCRISPPGHDGPCSAPEVAATVVARRKWATEQASNGELPRAVIVQSPMPMTNQFRSHADRLIQAGESLKGDIQDLPPVIQSWMMGASAQLALVQLWTVWLKVQAAGGTTVVLNVDDINNLVPEKLRIG